MPVMPNQYPPPKSTSDTKPSDTPTINESTIHGNTPFSEKDLLQDDDDLIVLPPEGVQRENTRSNNNDDLAPQVTDFLVTSSANFSPFEQDLGTPPFKDLHGDPIWPALAYTADGGVHPAKAGRHLDSPIRVPLGGREYQLPPNFTYSILRFDPRVMEYVPLTNEGKIPSGRVPVPAGCEYDGQRKLYFATARVPKTSSSLERFLGVEPDDKITVPGKWGEHLGAVHVAYGDHEWEEKHGEVLCWK